MRNYAYWRIDFGVLWQHYNNNSYAGSYLVEEMSCVCIPRSRKNTFNSSDRCHSDLDGLFSLFAGAT